MRTRANRGSVVSEQPSRLRNIAALFVTEYEVHDLGSDARRRIRQKSRVSHGRFWSTDDDATWILLEAMAITEAGDRALALEETEPLAERRHGSDRQQLRRNQTQPVAPGRNSC